MTPPKTSYVYGISLTEKFLMEKHQKFLTSRPQIRMNIYVPIAEKLEALGWKILEATEWEETKKHPGPESVTLQQGWVVIQKVLPTRKRERRYYRFWEKRGMGIEYMRLVGGSRRHRNFFKSYYPRHAVIENMDDIDGLVVRLPRWTGRFQTS